MDNIYDHICAVLTNYEGNGNDYDEGNPEPLYELLVEIQDMMSDGRMVTIDPEKEEVKRYD